MGSQVATFAIKDIPTKRAIAALDSSIAATNTELTAIAKRLSQLYSSASTTSASAQPSSDSSSDSFAEQLAAVQQDIVDLRSYVNDTISENIAGVAEAASNAEQSITAKYNETVAKINAAYSSVLAVYDGSDAIFADRSPDVLTVVSKKVIRIGPICIFDFYMQLAETDNAYSLLQLPKGFRPAHKIYGAIGRTKASATKGYHFYIEPASNETYPGYLFVPVDGATADSKAYILGNATYVTNDPVPSSEGD